MTLKEIQENLEKTPGRGIVTRVINKTTSTISFIGRNAQTLTVDKGIVLNFKDIPVFENGTGINKPVLIILSDNGFTSTFEKVTQIPCPTTISVFDLNSGTVNFSMI